MRLDQYLVENKYFPSREKASNAIKSKAILVDGKMVDKPSFKIDNQIIQVIKETNKFVSRGGYKLEKAIHYFNLDFNDKTILDIGSSTGGFTDCSLQYGAKEVYSVDVGSGQLDGALKCDLRVHSFESTNILDFKTNVEFDYLVMDVSFVSLKYILPGLVPFLTNSNSLIALIKPQYEIGKVKVKNGIVKDLKLHEKIINDIIEFIKQMDLKPINLTKSPITGKTGNVEYLIKISKTGNICNYNSKDIITKE